MRKWLGGAMASLLLVVSSGVSSQGMVAHAATNQELLPFAEQDNTGKHWGYLNQQGKIVIKPAYESAEIFDKQGLAIVSVSSGETATYGVINQTGQYVIPAVYDQIMPYGDQLFKASRGEASSLLDAKGKVVIHFEKSSISDLADGLAAFKQNGLYGYLDQTGKVAIQPAFKDADEFKDGIALVILSSGHYATVDKQGKINQWPLTEEQVYVHSLQDGIAPYYDRTTSLYGYIDQAGKIVVPAKYREASAYENGLAAVNINTEDYEAKTGLMNRQGEFVVKPEYSVINYLNNGMWAVGKGNGNGDVPEMFTSRYALVDHSGKFLTEMTYDAILPFEGEYAGLFKMDYHFTFSVE